MDELKQMEEYRRVVYSGTRTGIYEEDIYEEIEKNLGIDIRDNPHYEIISSGVTDNDGLSETPYYTFEVVKKYSIKIDENIPIEEYPPTRVSDPEELKEKKQDMLDKYYGNRAREIQYRRAMKRFKSHIVEKDDNGIKYKTVEDYNGIKEDMKFLQLEEYAYRLERLTRAEAGDFSMYEMVATNFIVSTSLEEHKKRKEELKKNSIEILRKSDADYIETNNYAYNQHQTTQENLKTLGKYGEKVPFIKIHKIKKGEKELPKKIIKNVGIVTYNAFLLGRNYVLAPIDKAIGTYLVAPVHKLLYNSNKNTAGIYKNKITHRYTARKMYYEQEYLLELQRQNQELRKQGKQELRPNIFKLVFQPRIYAIFNYKEGNKKVLSAGANEIEQSIIAYEKAQWLKEAKDKSLNKMKDNLLEKMSHIEEEIKRTTDKEEKTNLQILLQNAAERLIIIDERIEVNKKMNIGSVIQTDAISMQQHDVANKSNVTKVVTGVKTVARAALMYYVGKNLSKYVSEKITREEYVPEQVIETEHFVPGKFDQKTLEEIKISDLVEGTKNTTVSYGASSGKVVNKPGDSYIRGIFCSDLDGRKVSGSDGIGFDIVGRTNTKISQITEDSKLFEVMAETISNTKKTQVSAQDLIDQIVNSSNPQESFETLLENTRIWVSRSDKGIPTGWLDVSDGVKNVSLDISAGHTEIIKEVIPGYYTTVVDTAMKEVIDGRMVAVEALLAAGGARDLYELLRRTKSKEEMVEEKTHAQELKSFQKDNKPEFSKRRYESDWGFVGTRKGDYDSLYDENEMGSGRKR